MKKTGRRWLLYGVAFLLFLAAFFCLYKNVDLGVTAEEGMNYTVPHIPTAAPAFQKMKREADKWGDAFGAFAILSAVTAFSGYRAGR